MGKYSYAPYDFYSSVEALKRDVRLGRDYSIRTRQKKCDITIMAMHGGFIEEGTSAIAAAIAGNKYNLFDFQGLRPENARKLHVTSHRFREPKLDELTKRSRFAVSIHGMPDEVNGTDIWLGGLNYELKMLIKHRLEQQGFIVNASPPRYKGEHPNNAVNKPELRGVQLELPISLRRSMFQTELFYSNGRCPKTTEQFNRFVSAIRLAIVDYQLQTRSTSYGATENNSSASGADRGEKKMIKSVEEIRAIATRVVEETGATVGYVRGRDGVYTLEVRVRSESDKEKVQAEYEGVKTNVRLFSARVIAQ